MTHELDFDWIWIQIFNNAVAKLLEGDCTGFRRRFYQMYFYNSLLFRFASPRMFPSARESFILPVLVKFPFPVWPRTVTYNGKMTQSFMISGDLSVRWLPGETHSMLHASKDPCRQLHDWSKHIRRKRKWNASFTQIWARLPSDLRC